MSAHGYPSWEDEQTTTNKVDFRALIAAKHPSETLWSTTSRVDIDALFAAIREAAEALAFMEARPSNGAVISAIDAAKKYLMSLKAYKSYQYPAALNKYYGSNPERGPKHASAAPSLQRDRRAASARAQSYQTRNVP